MAQAEKQKMKMLAGALYDAGDDDAVIGAGSVVTRDVPRSATVVANPARVVKISRIDSADSGD